MSRVSDSGSIDSASTTARSFSASGVPPGSRVTTTSRPARRTRPAIQGTSVDLPAPSTPSSVMNRPRKPATPAIRLVSPFQLVFSHGAVVLIERARELARAVAARYVVQGIGFRRVQRGAQRGEPRSRDRRRRQPGARIGVVWAVGEQVVFLQVAVERVAQA